MPGSSSERMERPDVDKITAQPCGGHHEQKTTNKNPRLTVGTVNRDQRISCAVSARGFAGSPSVTGEEIVYYTDEQIVELIPQRVRRTQDRW